MNHMLANGMKIWKGKWNTTTLLSSLKGLEILHQEGRGQNDLYYSEFLMAHEGGVVTVVAETATIQLVTVLSSSDLI